MAVPDCCSRQRYCARGSLKTPQLYSVCYLVGMLARTRVSLQGSSLLPPGHLPNKKPGGLEALKAVHGQGGTDWLNTLKPESLNSKY